MAFIQSEVKCKSLMQVLLVLSSLLSFEKLRKVTSVRIRSFSGPYFSAFGLNISPYSVRMRENTDQKNSEYRQLSRSVLFHNKTL